MNFQPLIWREMQALARGRAMLFTRSGVGLAGVMMCMPQAVLVGPLASPAGSGRLIFQGICSAAFLLGCSASLLAADTVNVERREGTLGLLFLTRIKASDVLLAKAVSVGALGCCGIIALLPVLMVPILAGGVAGGEVFRKILALLDTLFVALACGLGAAALQRGRLTAGRGAVMLLGAIALLPALPQALFARTWALYLGSVSPLVLMQTAGDVEYTANPFSFWVSLLAVQATGWVLLIGAAARLRRTACEDWRRTSVRSRAPATPADHGLGWGRWQPAKDESSPLEWLAHRRHGVSPGLWCIMVGALAGARWVSLAHLPDALLGVPPPALFAWPSGMAASFVGGTLTAWVACRFFARVRRNGDLELLMTTPLGARQILSDQWNVLKRFFVWPVFFLQAAMLIPFLANGNPGRSRLPGGWEGHLVFVGLSFLNTLVGTAALCWAGLWSGFHARTQAAAILRTVGLVVVLPGVVALVASAFLVIPAGPFSPPLPQSFLPLSTLPELAILVYHVGVIRWAYLNLTAELSPGQPRRVEVASLLFARSIPPGFALRTGADPSM